MRFNLVFLVLFLGFISCSEQEARRPITTSKSKGVVSTTTLLKKINKAELSIKKAIKEEIQIKKSCFPYLLLKSITIAESSLYCEAKMFIHPKSISNA